MTETLDNKLVVGISARSLFDLEESNRIFETEGLESYTKHQLERENDPPEPGVAFPLVKRLLDLRSPKSQEPLVEVILFTRNGPDIAVRLFNAINAHHLNITRGVFTGGKLPYNYLSAFNATLCLSANEETVRKALQHGVAAATVMPGSKATDDDGAELRIGFDGDAILFSDEAERIYQRYGLTAFTRHEQRYAETPLSPGPFKQFLEGLGRIQKLYRTVGGESPISIALITARSAATYKRAITTLRSWDIMVDAAFFLSGLDKRPVLAEYRPHIYFDDQQLNCDTAAHVVPTGHVPSGVTNEGPEGA
jgi:5'-nucleotidase